MLLKKVVPLTLLYFHAVTLHISFSLFDFFLLPKAFWPFSLFVWICLLLMQIIILLKSVNLLEGKINGFFLKIISEQPLSNTNLTFNKGIWRPVCKENVYWYLVGLVLKYELMCIYIYGKYQVQTHTYTQPSLSLSRLYVDEQLMHSWAFPFFPNGSVSIELILGMLHGIL